VIADRSQHTSTGGVSPDRLHRRSPQRMRSRLVISPGGGRARRVDRALGGVGQRLRAMASTPSGMTHGASRRVIPRSSAAPTHGGSRPARRWTAPAALPVADRVIRFASGPHELKVMARRHTAASTCSTSSHRPLDRVERDVDRRADGCAELRRTDPRPARWRGSGGATCGRAKPGAAARATSGPVCDGSGSGGFSHRPRPGVLERPAAPRARVAWMRARAPSRARTGHLIDLEPLWLARVHDIWKAPG
jgi:hypothetical protein